LEYPRRGKKAKVHSHAKDVIDHIVQKGSQTAKHESDKALVANTLSAAQGNPRGWLNLLDKASHKPKDAIEAIGNPVKVGGYIARMLLNSDLHRRVLRRANNYKYF
jgi:hypothetical protein